MKSKFNLLVAVLLLCGVASAQVGTQASIVGTVTDTTGARVGGTLITAMNLETGQRVAVSSNQNGDFSILALPIGQYRVQADAKTFKSWVLPSLNLTVGGQFTLAPVLEIGSVNDTVTVTAGGAALQTDSATVETVIQLDQIRELPLDGRNPLALLALVPGVTYTADTSLDIFARFLGLRNLKSSFQLDGIAANDGLTSGGTAVPNVDAVQQMNVQTLNAGAGTGRDPMQVLLVTKNGTNNVHGSAYDYLQNDFFNAWNAFAKGPGQLKPKVRYDLFGATLGGPILRNKTFFFVSFQGIITHNTTSYNSAAIDPSYLAGNFGTSQIKDPFHPGQFFANNTIPTSQFSEASKYFLPLLLTANAKSSPTVTVLNRYQAGVVTNQKTYETLARLDQQITSNQRIYGRYLYLDRPTEVPGFNADPSWFGSNTIIQNNIGVTYTWTPDSRTLLTLTAGEIKNRNAYSNPRLGKQNDSVLAGIQGISTLGRESRIGPPDIAISGYTGVSFAGGFGGPGFLKSTQSTGKASLARIEGRHQLGIGFEYGNRRVFGGHGSSAGRGVFSFSGQYTGNAVADYLLGLTSSSSLNDPLNTFGVDSSPENGVYVTDVWKARQNLTLDLGVRFDHYYTTACYKHLCDGWDKTLQEAVVDVDETGNPNFSTFASSATLAAQTAGLWVTTSQAGYKHGLFDPTNNWSPRVGITYSPYPQHNVIVRAGYGTFYSQFTGNRSASQINMPTWSLFSHTYSAASLQSWQTVWAGGVGVAPTGFAINSPLVNTQLAQTKEWNVSVETVLPANFTFTLTYIGAVVPNEITPVENNAASVGPHKNIDADRPLPRFASIHTFENTGWYGANGLTAYLERRYRDGFSMTFSYCFSKTLESNTGASESDTPLAYAPAWYYHNYRSVTDYRHLQSATAVFQLPYGHGRRFGANSNIFLNAIAGGWTATAIENARSGNPLFVTQSNLNLGNGFSSHADVIGNPQVANPSKTQWFNTKAYALAPSYTFGDSKVGEFEGPAFLQVNASLSKSFYGPRESSVQFRADAFNVLNHVNLSDPTTSISSSLFGSIASSYTARYMQLALKLTF